jgi:hypothetical protein
MLHILHSPRLPRQLVRQEQPPQALVVFPDAQSAAQSSRAKVSVCISRHLLK